MKVIAYSLFGKHRYSREAGNYFEFMAYLRGIYFNARMNKLIYPEWTTWVAMEGKLYEEYKDYFERLNQLFGVVTLKFDYNYNDAQCEAMLWRMAPIWSAGVSHVLCRDADAIATYREAQAVNEWLASGMAFHGITDNKVHTEPMMGGMVGFDVKQFHEIFPEWTDLGKMIDGLDLSVRGSDQNLLRTKIFSNHRHRMMAHYLLGLTPLDEGVGKTTVDTPVPNISPRLWESDLTCRHIGSAGVVEMELLRFFRRFNDRPEFHEFEKQFNSICYWA